MKLCILSDSHGAVRNMIAVVEREKPQLCFFLGDGERDLAAVQAQFPDLPFYAVRGNCDLRSALSTSLTCVVDGVKIFAVHGHLHQVKYESWPETLCAAARAAGADLALFGHTHQAFCVVRDGITLFNPGSVGRGAHPAYGMLTVRDGGFGTQLKTL